MLCHIEQLSLAYEALHTTIQPEELRLHICRQWFIVLYNGTEHNPHRERPIPAAHYCCSDN